MLADLPSMYFAFPDGVLHHVCAECAALCCKGQGFGGSLGREMGQLLHMYPALESMVVSRQGDLLTFATPAGRCHFLADDNLCRIEKEHGKALKPGVCTLFPFNVFGRIGNTITVSPHFLCPLRLELPARPGTVEGTHARLAAAVAESGLLAPQDIARRLPKSRLHPSEDARAVLAREKSFLAACSAALQKHKFRTVLNRQLARGAVLDKFLARAAAVLGIALSRRPIVRDALDDVLLVIAPALRLGLLRLPTDGMLKALALGEVIVRRTRALSSAPPTLQGTYDLLVKIGPTLRLLASDQEPLVLPKLRNMKLPPFEAPQVMFAAFAAHRAAERRTPTLEALEKAIQPTLSTADRALLLLDLGSRADVAAVTKRR